jgi:glutaredoxin-like YruB-family protein
MKIKEITSHEEMLKAIKDKEKAFVFLYKKDSDLSNCALKNINAALTETEKLTMVAADVSSVKDIHENYNISSVPSLLEFENGSFIKVIKGCNDESYYKILFDNVVFYSASGEKPKNQKNVVVYSTPTCSWCTTLKNYLRKNNVRFRDIDVSRDENSAQEMVKKSGQQGVPQMNINGRIVVGFDRNKINELLEIQYKN